MNAKLHSQHSAIKQRPIETALRYLHTQRVVFNTAEPLTEYNGLKIMFGNPSHIKILRPQLVTISYLQLQKVLQGR